VPPEVQDCPPEVPAGGAAEDSPPQAPAEPAARRRQSSCGACRCCSGGEGRTDAVPWRMRGLMVIRDELNNEIGRSGSM